MTTASADRLAEVFVELADTLVADFDLIAFLHTLTDASVELLGVDAAGLMFLDERGTLRSAATTGDVETIEKFEISSGRGPCLTCVASGEPVVNIDADEARRRWGEFQELAEREGYIAIHALPLRLRGEVIGGINLYCARSAMLSPAQQKIAQALADVATIGLLQERIIRDKTVLTEQLQTALNSRVLIEQAKGIVAERTSVTPSEAFSTIRAHARRHGLNLAIVARDVIDGALRLPAAELSARNHHPGSGGADVAL